MKLVITQLCGDLKDGIAIWLVRRTYTYLVTFNVK